MFHALLPISYRLGDRAWEEASTLHACIHTRGRSKVTNALVIYGMKCEMPCEGLGSAPLLLHNSFYYSKMMQGEGNKTVIISDEKCESSFKEREAPQSDVLHP